MTLVLSAVVLIGLAISVLVIRAAYKRRSF